MTVKLLSKQHLEFLSLKGGCTSLSESNQNATLLEFSCRGSNLIKESPGDPMLLSESLLLLHTKFDGRLKLYIKSHCNELTYIF